jgi:hypothetical protein
VPVRDLHCGAGQRRSQPGLDIVELPHQGAPDQLEQGVAGASQAGRCEVVHSLADDIRVGHIERDLEEFDALFAASGWRCGKTYPVGGGYSGLELEAV